MVNDAQLCNAGHINLNQYTHNGNLPGPAMLTPEESHAIETLYQGLKR